MPDEMLDLFAHPFGSRDGSHSVLNERLGLLVCARGSRDGSHSVLDEMLVLLVCFLSAHSRLVCFVFKHANDSVLPASAKVIIQGYGLRPSHIWNQSRVTVSGPVDENLP